jgi:uncharacterized membrane protein
MTAYRPVLLNTLLFLHLLGGVFAMAMDLRYPFSDTKEVAQFLAAHAGTTTVIAGNDFMVSPMTAYLNRKVYMLESGVFGTFMVWNNKRRAKDSNETIQALNELLNHGNQDLLFVSRRPWDPGTSDLEISELAKFTKSLNGDTFYVYQVRRLRGNSTLPR